MSEQRREAREVVVMAANMFSPGKPTNGGCQGDGHYICRECGLFDERSEG